MRSAASFIAIVNRVRLVATFVCLTNLLSYSLLLLVCIVLMLDLVLLLIFVGEKPAAPDINRNVSETNIDVESLMVFYCGVQYVEFV